MVNGNTVVVVGAGASNECKLPTGRELKERIARLLDIRFNDDFSQRCNNDLLFEALRVYGHSNKIRDMNPLLASARQIARAMPMAISIDNYLECHAGNQSLEICGKLAITQAILSAEKESLLYVDPRGSEQHPQYSALSDTWYAAFMQLLTQNCRLEQLPERLSKITFVVFNYDRCVEHFIWHSVQNIYGIGAPQAAELLKCLRLFHPYGAVGSLPWQQRDAHIGFGETVHATQLLTLASNLKTFTQGTDPSASDIQEIRKSLREATTVIFLGFAYYKQNLQLLKPGTRHTEERVRYYGTAFGMSKSDCDLIKTDLAGLGRAKATRITLRNDLRCEPFFREYWRSLSLG